MGYKPGNHIHLLWSSDIKIVGWIVDSPDKGELPYGVYLSWTEALIKEEEVWTQGI